jgi:hypothetical protein
MSGGKASAAKIMVRAASRGALLGLACQLAACAGSSSQMGPKRVESVRYATLYLGSDGGIVRRDTVPRKEIEAQAYWNGDGVTGPGSIVINLTQQKAMFYKGGKLVGVSPISTGREGYRTPSGSFTVIQKNRDHVSNLYGDYVDAAGNVMVSNVGVNEDRRPPGAIFRGAPMPYFMRIHNGVGMHAGYLPGFADSHGCIRLPEHMAQTFFANASVGTPVRVAH